MLCPLLIFYSVFFLGPLLDIFCIFLICISVLYICASILFLRFWIIFTTVTLNSFSGALPISSSFVWSCEVLPCSFICCMFRCLFILFNLLCLKSPLCQPESHSSSQLWSLSPVGETGPVICGFLVWGGLVPVFWWMDLGLVSLKGSVMSNSVFWGTYRFGMALGSLSIWGQFCVPILLNVWQEASSTGACWPLGVGVGLGLSVEMEASGRGLVN